MKGFHLAVLTKMGLQPQAEALQNPKLNPESETGAAMLNRLNRGIEDLSAVAEFLME